MDPVTTAAITGAFDPVITALVALATAVLGYILRQFLARTEVKEAQTAGIEQGRVIGRIEAIEQQQAAPTANGLASVTRAWAGDAGNPVDQAVMTSGAEGPSWGHGVGMSLEARRAPSFRDLHGDFAAEIALRYTFFKDIPIKSTSMAKGFTLNNEIIIETI